MATTTSISAGPGFTGLLTILFIALKLFGVIRWSWIWVLAPMWIPLAFFLTIALALLVLHLAKS